MATIKLPGVGAPGKLIGKVVPLPVAYPGVCAIETAICYRVINSAPGDCAPLAFTQHPFVSGIPAPGKMIVCAAPMFVIVVTTCPALVVGLS
jgi:hypothetical protein